MNDIQAIDVHIHLVDEASIKARGGRTEQMARYMGYKLKVISVDEMADQYRERKMMAVLMNTTDASVTGLAPVHRSVAGKAGAPGDPPLQGRAGTPWDR